MSVRPAAAHLLAAEEASARRGLESLHRSEAADLWGRWVTEISDHGPEPAGAVIKSMIFMIFRPPCLFYFRPPCVFFLRDQVHNIPTIVRFFPHTQKNFNMRTDSTFFIRDIPAIGCIFSPSGIMIFKQKNNMF